MDPFADYCAYWSDACTGNGNAGMYGVSVLPGHRRQGIGRSLVQARMRRALEHGLRWAVAATTPDGAGLARSLDYEEVGHLHQLVWFPT